MEARPFALDDERLLEELGLVRSVAQRVLGDTNDADDVVQEAWLRTRTAPVRFESRGRLRAWLAALAHRMARDTLRARRRRLAREARAARLETRADAADVLERSALLERLLQAVRALDEPQRSTVLLRYLDGHTTAEIASAMSVSEDVVRKRLTRTRAHLRATLGLEDEAPAERKGARRRALQIASCVGLLALAAALLLQGLGAEPRPEAGPVTAEATTEASTEASTEAAEPAPPEPRAEVESIASASEPELSADPAGAPSAEQAELHDGPVAAPARILSTGD